MRDHDDRRALPVELGHQVHDTVTGLGIKVSCRLIAEKDVGIVDECPCNGNPLLLTARNLGRCMA